MKNIGFTFDEKILYTDTLEGFFEKLPFPINHLELAPDYSLFSQKTYEDVATYSKNLNFHMPYFITDQKYDFAFNAFKSFDAFFLIVDHLRPLSIKKPSIVIHGSREKDKSLSHDQTKRGLEYLLNFINKKKLDVILRLENTEVLSAHSLYDLANVNKIIETFKSPQLKLCYDMAHDYYGAKNFVLPDNNLLSYMDYYHLHGKNTLKHQDLNYFPKELLKTIKDKGDLTIELLLSNCQEDYSQTLINNLLLLNRL